MKIYDVEIITVFFLFAGIHCETDIDDCFSSPCQNGATCIDGVAAFKCICTSGFQGALCETEINECELITPCANNATCVDLVADYQCVCDSIVLEAGKAPYGGRNCTVALVGCQNDVCANRATCRPLLIDERTNNQSFVCECNSGFAGPLCDIATSVSFVNNQGWIRYSDALGYNAVDISLEFRTTLLGKNLGCFSVLSAGVSIRRAVWFD
jgi:protein crumbs